MKKKVILDWLRTVDENFYEEKYIIENNIINSNGNIELNISSSENQLKYNFGEILGDFQISGRLKNFVGFPTKVSGKIEASYCAFENWEGWEVQKVGSYINLCSLNSKLEDLNGLYDTKFQRLIFKVQNGILDKEISVDYLFNNYINSNLRSKWIDYDSFQKMKKDNLVQDNTNYDDYLVNLFKDSSEISFT